jgi:flagellar basal body-associated protein FliL
MSQILLIILPLFTFLLGCAFTIWFKRIEEKRESKRRSSIEIYRLVKEWYNQIHKLASEASSTGNIKILKHKLEHYLENRTILPDILYHLGVIKKDIGYRELSNATEQFLKKVTDYNPTKPNQNVGCLWIGHFIGLENQAKGTSHCCSEKVSNIKRKREMQKLDEIVQSVSRLASASPVPRFKRWRHLTRR